MRGHWESGTRKLNKHYQSGGKGTPSPLWRWGKYLTGGGIIPYCYDHDPDWDNDYQDPDVYYNKVFTQVGDVLGTSNSANDFVHAYPFEGPIADRYDGLVMPGILNGDSGGFRAWYDQEVADRKRPMRDPDYPTSSYNWDLHLNRDLGKRFVRFHNPRWGFGPSYYTQGTVLGQYYRLGQSDPILTDIRIEAKACKMQSQVVGRNQQITCRSIRPGRTDYSNVIFDTQADNVEGWNIYDFEQNGQAYVEHLAQNVIWDYDNQIRKDVLFRVYTFIDNGDIYVDLLPHTLDPVTLQPIQWADQWYIALDRFPGNVGGYCHMDPYTQPTTDYETYPCPMLQWPNTPGGVSIGYANQAAIYTTFDADIYQRVLLREGIGVMGPGKVFEEDYSIRALFNANAALNNRHMRVFDVSESDFWAAESAWHQLHGGTPYLTPDE